MKRLIGTLFFLGIIFSYFFLDRPLAFYFQEASSFVHAFGNAIAEVMDPKVQILLWLVVFFIVRFIKKNKNWGERILFVLLTIGLSNVVVGLLKPLFGRVRPVELIEKGLYGFYPFQLPYSECSFPSSHAVTIGALVAAFAFLFPRHFWLLLTAGFVVSLCRVISVHHYLSDVMAGVLISSLMAQWIYSKMQG